MMRSRASYRYRLYEFEHAADRSDKELQEFEGRSSSKALLLGLPVVDVPLILDVVGGGAASGMYIV